MKYCTVCKIKYEDGVSFCPTDGEVLEDDPSSIVGSVLDGQYQIESLLGKGGMGAVYLARHILLGDRVAIKILPPEVRNNADWLRRFRREGQAARRLRHANAVAVHDLRTAADGTIYMVMEYVDGQTLDVELKKRGRFTPTEAFEILEPIMSVLSTAHSLGVVHRDLKPENIMIGKEGNGQPVVKLLDLGIAKMREIAGVESSGTTELTIAGQVLGTPHYMSPEQWGELSRDGSFEIDGRADIYSLGLVAYQMISGRRPYSAVTLNELRREHISLNPPPLSEKVPGVSRAFSDVIGRAIAKDRDDRQASAGELAAQLRTALLETSATGDAEGTLSHVPYAEASSAHTLVIPEASNTRSDVDAPTIVTFDVRPTTPPSPSQPVNSQSGHREAAAVIEPAQPPPAVAEADLASSITVEQTPRAAAGLTVPKRSGGKALVFVGAAVLVLLLLVVGVGGFFAIGWMRAKPDDGATKGTTGSSETEIMPATKELGRYWLDIDTQEKSEAIRAGDLVTMKSGQSFKFHFVPRQNGYLYVVGPVEESAPAAFLTAKPNAQSGLSTNEVKSGQDFTFPADTGKDYHWLTLDLKPGTENYTIIFSPEPLSVPAFLSSEATGKPLSETERAELKAFLVKYKNGGLATETNENDAAAPFVTVKVPQSKATKDSSAPLIFEVRIQHK